MGLLKGFGAVALSRNVPQLVAEGGLIGGSLRVTEQVALAQRRSAFLQAGTGAAQNGLLAVMEGDNFAKALPFAGTYLRFRAELKTCSGE
jgi:hypothetical protein